MRSGEPLGTLARAIRGLDQSRRLVGLKDSHRAYLSWHRTRVFTAGAI
jgi:hypothetical protein